MIERIVKFHKRPKRQGKIIPANKLVLITGAKSAGRKNQEIFLLALNCEQIGVETHNWKYGV